MNKRLNALLIGVSSTEDYQSVNNIGVNINQIKNLLTQSSLFNSTERHINVNQDNSVTGILKAISSTINKFEGDDELLFIYYSGHGFISKIDFEYYLSTSETSSSYIEASSIPAERIKKFIKKSRAKQKVIILDSCFSGKFSGLLSDGDTLIQNSVQIKDEDGVFILTSSNGATPSTYNIADNTVPTDFTKSLLEIAQEGLSNNNPFLTTGEIYKRVVEKLSHLKKPIPLQFSDRKGYDIKLLKNPQCFTSTAKNSDSKNNVDKEFIVQNTISILDGLFEVDRICVLYKDLNVIYESVRRILQAIFDQSANIVSNYGIEIKILLNSNAKFSNKNLIYLLNALSTLDKELEFSLESKVQERFLWVFRWKYNLVRDTNRSIIILLSYFIKVVVYKLNNFASESFVHVEPQNFYTKNTEEFQRNLFSRHLLFGTSFPASEREIQERLKAISKKIKIMGLPRSSLYYTTNDTYGPDGDIEWVDVEYGIGSKQVKLHIETLNNYNNGLSNS